MPEEGRTAVKLKRFRVEQIVAVLRQAEAGVLGATLITGLSKRGCLTNSPRESRLAAIPLANKPLKADSESVQKAGHNGLARSVCFT